METPVAFCTYFDSRYLSRALALYESLQVHAPNAPLFSLCMDDRAADILERLALPGLHAIRLTEFEAGDEELRFAKSNRSLIEYYFTCTPSLPLFVMRREPGIARLFYVDADFYFFSSATAILEEWGDRSIYIVGHRFPDSLRSLERHGKFNVGILGFCNDAEGRRCLDRWRKQCNEWCYDRLEDGKFGDQKYLDTWPDEFGGVVVSEHPGVNLAPWNRSRHQLGKSADGPRIDGRAIVCYHFHGLNRYRFGVVRPESVRYGPKLSRDWIRLIYEPYLRALERADAVTGLGHFGDLRHRRSLSLADLTIAGAHGHFLIEVGGRTIEVPPSFLESLRLARRTLATGRNLLRSVRRRAFDHSSTNAADCGS